MHLDECTAAYLGMCYLLSLLDGFLEDFVVC